MAYRLTVDGLPRSFTDEDLQELFQSYGRILKAMMIHSLHIPSYHYGSIEMATADEAERAREALNGTMVDHHVILVFTSRQDK